MNTRYYVDVIRVWFVATLFPRDRIRILKRFSGGKVVVSFRRMLVKKPKGWVRVGPWEVRVLIHQPFRQALWYLARWSRFDEVLVNYVEVSVDILCQNRAAADELFDYLAERLVLLRKSRTNKVFRHKNTLYFGPRKSGARTNIALYSDKLSKPSIWEGDPKSCCHLDLRLSRAASCKSVGVTRCEHVLSLDLPSVLQKRVQLLELPQENGTARLGQCLLGVPLRKSPVYRKSTNRGGHSLAMNPYVRVGGAHKLLSLVEHRDPDPDNTVPLFSVQTLLDRCQKQFKVRRVLKSVVSPWSYPTLNAVIPRKPLKDGA
jgi:hypothetical protein